MPNYWNKNELRQAVANNFSRREIVEAYYGKRERSWANVAHEFNRIKNACYEFKIPLEINQQKAIAARDAKHVERKLGKLPPVKWAEKMVEVALRQAMHS